MDAICKIQITQKSSSQFENCSTIPTSMLFCSMNLNQSCDNMLTFVIDWVYMIFYKKKYIKSIENFALGCPLIQSDENASGTFMWTGQPSCFEIISFKNI